MSDFHTPVLLNEIISFLDPKPGMRFIDATLGGGGHTQALLEHGSSVLAIDRDADALAHAREHLSEFLGACPEFRSGVPGVTPRLVLVHDNFDNLDQISINCGLEPVDGIIFDLGVSSHQIQTGPRGFSFSSDGPLDMRADPQSQNVTAGDLVNSLSEHELTKLFQKFGQEPRAGSIARAIVSTRGIKPILTTGQLAAVVMARSRVAPKVHPATRVFQALRIAVNSELDNLGIALTKVPGILKPGGRLVTISFHSLEDRIVKNFLKENPKLFYQNTRKPITPSLEEVAKNPRSRSAKMRLATKF